MSLFFYSLSKSILSPQNISTRFRFFLILIYFLCTPLAHMHEWACGLWISLFGILVFLISLYFLMKLVLLFTLCILYKQSNLQAKITA